ncbi:unnamed protein product [Sphenostylis stenocarpa]|uniref:Uncharacterized protein n=1 Tax=Sphenostylis stenocarpa TaxID=92480 RepID=A0AA86VYC7_9FABA|nr:unnamed protein product [Sphenostylis stenocarpa]
MNEKGSPNPATVHLQPATVHVHEPATVHVQPINQTTQNPQPMLPDLNMLPDPLSDEENQGILKEEGPSTVAATVEVVDTSGKDKVRKRKSLFDRVIYPQEEEEVGRRRSCCC